MEQMPQIMPVVRPGEKVGQVSWGKTLIHRAYRLGAGPHLYRANMAQLPRGGLLGIESGEGVSGGDFSGLRGEILRECAARHAGGVVLFLDQREEALAGLCSQVSRALGERGLSCCVPELYGLAAPESQVYLSTALSGGSLRERLGEAIDRFGRERLTLWVEPVAEDFLLPSPTGAGEKLGEGELEERKKRQGRGSVFFSEALCAHYFTYMEGAQGHFVLFDDGASLARKLRLAGELGVERAMMEGAVWEGLAAAL